MNYDEFKNEFSSKVLEGLADAGYKDLSSEFGRVEKLNASYDSLVIGESDAKVGFNLNMTQTFEMFQQGINLNLLVEDGITSVVKALNEISLVDIDSLNDYSIMKTKLVMQAVSMEANKDLLETVPHKEMEDIAIAYRFVIDNFADERSSVLVTNKLLETYDITADELHKDALENAPILKPASIQGMTEVMRELFGEEADLIISELPEEKEPIYVASVPYHFHGASVLGYKDFMDNAAEKLEGDFFILPSSIHEVLLVKDDGNVDLNNLKEMVKSVNETQVSPEEKLTDSVYHYDSKEHIFELGEKFEARQRIKKERGKEKESLVGKLHKTRGNLDQKEEKHRDKTKERPVL